MSDGPNRLRRLPHVYRQSPEAGGLARGMLVLFCRDARPVRRRDAGGRAIDDGHDPGRVTDPEGLALPGATVTATNTETGATRAVVTDSEGTYFIGALQVGLYRIDVTLSGFRSFQQEAFSLSAAQNARVDAQLAVGGLTEAIDVVATKPRVDTRSSAVVTTVDLQRMQELPMLNRSVLSMAVLSPGITEVTVPDAVTNQRTPRAKWSARRWAAARIRMTSSWTARR